LKTTSIASGLEKRTAVRFLILSGWVNLNEGLALQNNDDKKEDKQMTKKSKVKDVYNGKTISEKRWTIVGLSTQIRLLLDEFERITGMKVLDFYGQWVESVRLFSGHEVEIRVKDKSGEMITSGTFAREEMTVELKRGVRRKKPKGKGDQGSQA
jgi:hypothetical protein